MIIDNQNNPVAAATTILIPKSRQHNSQKNMSELAKGLVVRGQANLVIKGEHFGLTFDELRVEDDSVVEFFQQKDTVYIRFLHNMFISKNAVLDLHKTNYVLIYQPSDVGNVESVTNLGRIYFKETLAIRGRNVNLLGDIKVPTGFTDREKVMSNFYVEADNLTVHESVSIESGFHFLHANSTIELKKDSKVLSLRNHMCNLRTSSPDMFTCMNNRAQQADRIDEVDIISRFNEQFPGS